jgi:hypothetical protein
MASGNSDRGIAIAMGVVPLVGILLSAMTTDTSQWTGIAWLFAAVCVLISVLAFFYAFTGRSVIGKLPTDPTALNRVKVLSFVVLGAMAFILILELGSALTGSWASTDGMFIGIYASIAIMFLGRLRAIKAQEAQAS